MNARKRNPETVMEEMELQDRPRWVARMSSMWRGNRREAYEEPVAYVERQYNYSVTVRKDIISLDDARAAANGIKRGEQQVLNLSKTDPTMRQHIVDFLAGVNFTIEGTWEEIGENIFMIVPPTAHVEVAPPTPRMAAARN
ncbi:MAG: cell division protein SepF [Fimbriimonadaceae bacterium]|nr:cell division protein SepF [Fimbriimonadaceae bacterium]